MADTKITGLTADTAPDAADLVETVDDVAGTPVNKKVTLGNLIKGLIVANLTAKATPIGADEVMVGDSAASNVAKKSTLTELGAAIRDLLAINSATDLAAPATGDEILLADVSAANVIRKADLASVLALADHDALTNFVADEHVAHSGVDIGTAATSGLSGGGSIAATRALVVAPAQATAKTAPIPADLALIGDTEAASAVKKSTLAELNPAINAQITDNAETASFTFALTDRGKTTTISNAGATTATIPPNSSVAFPVNTILVLEQIGAGACTWTPGAGVTINNNANVTLITNGQHSVSFARKTATDVWTVYGNVVPIFPTLDQTFAISDETTALTTGTAKLSWYSPPYAITLLSIAASVVTAPTGASLIVDVNAGGSTIMTTNKLTIEVSEFHTKDATTQPTLTTTAIAANTLMTADIDQIGSTIAGAGAKIIWTYRKT